MEKPIQTAITKQMESAIKFKIRPAVFGEEGSFFRATAIKTIPRIARGKLIKNRTQQLMNRKEQAIMPRTIPAIDNPEACLRGGIGQADCIRRYAPFFESSVFS